MKKTDRPPASAKSSTKKKSIKRQFSSDGQLELRGNKIILHGSLAREVAEVARQAGISIQRVFTESVRFGLPELIREHRARQKRV